MRIRLDETLILLVWERECPYRCRQYAVLDIVWTEGLASMNVGEFEVPYHLACGCVNLFIIKCSPLVVLQIERMMEKVARSGYIR